MKFQRILLAMAAVFVLTTVTASAADSYSFKVKNTTDTKITKILVSEDGQDYGYFDIGSGIKPGQSMKLVWDASTNGESCKQWFKAVFADGSESKPVKFDFCEEDLELEF